MIIRAGMTLPRWPLAAVGAMTLSLTGLACYPAGTPGTGGPSQGSTGAPAAAPTSTAGQGGAPTAAAVPAPTATPAPPNVPGAQATFWEGADLSPREPVVALSTAEQRKRFVMQPGYRIEPILTEPAIEQPGQITFDANGRMYVLELRSYMLDADARDELAPINRISRWEDRNSDGIYETGTVFVDSLVFPRFVTPLQDGVILTKESNADEVWKYSDTNGDGVADQRELFTTGFGRQANVEHQEAHLTWAMDNWMYATYASVRLRWSPSGALREPIGSPGGSWGVTQDNDGKVWIQAGASGLPGYYQLPLAYGNFTVGDQMDPALRTPYGLTRLADVQDGMPSVRKEDGAVIRTTAGAGANIYRGHRLPRDLVGDYFYGEQVSRALRRVRPRNTEGVTQIGNFYEAQKTEFIQSTDPLFRPVDNKTAPDGTIYIADMYHGIIQEGQWTQPGSYLRAKLDQYQMDKIVGYGRIWRVTYDGIERDRTQPRMFQETSAQLVGHLSHPNGWWRDMAQQQLVLRQDRSVVPALRTLARTSSNELARMHALWALEGLGALDVAFARQLMKDASPRVRVQAIRASETLYKANDRSLAAEYASMTRDRDADVAIQAMLTLNALKISSAPAAIRAAMSANPARGVQEFGRQLLDPPAPAGGGAGGLSAAQRALLARGETLFRESCTECHGQTGMGTPVGDGMLMAPALAGNPDVQGHPDVVIRTLLHGLTGPIAGKSYVGGTMVPQKQSDDWIAAVASYIRTGLTNQATLVTPEQVSRVRAATASRTSPYTYDELTSTVPMPLAVQPTWKATASHNGRTSVAAGIPDPISAFSFEGWTTGVPQQPGMWYQVELPETVTLSAIQFTSRTQAVPVPAGSTAPPSPPTILGPLGYRVQVSTDGTNWSAPVAEGKATEPTTLIDFAPVPARFVRITQTAGAGPTAPVWTMARLRLFERITRR
ncbi:MAG: c-type cytochrome [Gemmatimonadetes bacterium]|nr:c-type cytochrome [Gemmatimonadota bacterium]